MDSKGGAIFKQKRVGKDEKPFVCYKFRTMFEFAPPNRPSGDFKDSYKYVTRVGRFLRKTSLDELPQLFNVIKGDMSIVGPRPLIIEEREMHERRKKNGVYSLRPGLTGLSQIRGRDRVSDEDKIRYDTEYVSSVWFVRDISIVARTFGKVLRSEGIASYEKKK
jgi:lipopolysaccharide/colanic/teichoic acid biosynthesis glycosyltransferase